MLHELRERLRRDGSVDLVVRVRPQAQHTRFKGQRSDGVWKIDVAAAPEDGAANESLRRFLAEEFGVSFACVTVVSGQTSREKRLRVTAPPR